MKRSRKKILDEFTNLRVSRQRKGQLRHQRDGLCTICGQPRCGESNFCLKHWIASRERQRKRIGATSRNRGAKSYQLEADAKAGLKRRAKKASARK